MFRNLLSLSLIFRLGDFFYVFPDIQFSCRKNVDVNRHCVFYSAAHNNVERRIREQWGVEPGLFRLLFRRLSFQKSLVRRMSPRGAPPTAQQPCQSLWRRQSEVRTLYANIRGVISVNFLPAAQAQVSKCRCCCCSWFKVEKNCSICLFDFLKAF